MDTYIVAAGLPDSLKPQAYEIYDEAFRRKTGLMVADPAKRREFFLRVIHPPHCVTAVRGDQLLGIAGFQTADASFSGGMFGGGLPLGTAWKLLGPAAALRAWLVSRLFLRRARKGELVLDGIAVASNCRSGGIGGAVLREVVRVAGATGHHTVRLDVIDTNPRAHAFYLKQGFTPSNVRRYEFLRGILGFGATTTMHIACAPAAEKA